MMTLRKVIVFGSFANQCWLKNFNMEDVFYYNSLLYVKTDFLWLEQTLYRRGKRILKANNYSVEKISYTLLRNNIKGETEELSVWQ